jgi:hypothetical protein
MGTHVQAETGEVLLPGWEILAWFSHATQRAISGMRLLEFLVLCVFAPGGGAESKLCRSSLHASRSILLGPSRWRGGRSRCGSAGPPCLAPGASALWLKCGVLFSREMPHDLAGYPNG